MTLNEFNKMTLARKQDLIWEWGYYLTNCRYGNYNIVIFSIGDYFVEACMNISENKAERVKAVKLEELHNDYIAAISRDKPFMRPFLAKNRDITLKAA
ncbi:MAG: hypothetical protein K0S32_3429 [Bacteroidetes bacterium]|jgi:hypothetical protein|nr:hypothetical protein [Bacteroidota bacterium]